MLISLSGVQGSGKTTILAKLKELGYGVIERKTARSILADWNLKLEEVYADSELTVRFQEELLKRKQEDEEDAVASKNLWFTERSFADVFVYALVANGHFNKYDEWINSYFNRCAEANRKYGAVFFLNKPSNRSIENDGVRGINQHYVRQVDSVLDDTSRRMTLVQEHGFYHEVTPLLRVSNNIETVEQRARFVVERSTDLWLENRLHVDSSGCLTGKHPIRIEADLRAKEQEASFHAAKGVVFQNAKTSD